MPFVLRLPGLWRLIVREACCNAAAKLFQLMGRLILDIQSAYQGHSVELTSEVAPNFQDALKKLCLVGHRHEENEYVQHRLPQRVYHYH